MSRTLVVLGGGGALGAFQAGGLLALLEAGVVPDALYGCSAGALNAAYLAVRPDVERARELARWWCDREAAQVLAPSWRTHVRRAPRMLSSGLLDPGPLRALVARSLPTHDLSELAVPLSVTTTCLDCAAPVHHRYGDVVDALVASCALPGLLPPVTIDGHRHVDGGVLCGVPTAAALADAGPDDSVLVLDCGLAPVTAGPSCATRGEGACGLVPVRSGYVPPVESARGALDVVLAAFTVARAVANTAVTPVDDPRLRVLPHVADAWAAGLLPQLPRGPRDVRLSPSLVDAGRLATQRWFSGVPAPRERDVPAR